MIAGGGVRAVLEAAGVRDVLTKAHGSNNPVNVVRATIKALQAARVAGSGLGAPHARIDRFARDAHRQIAAAQLRRAGSGGNGRRARSGKAAAAAAAARKRGRAGVTAHEQRRSRRAAARSR